MVGNKGMTGARRFLLGSVPNRISHHAPCAVMIIRTTLAPRARGAAPGVVAAAASIRPAP